jgi:hypothetical protein
MTANLEIDGVTVPLTESCKFSDSEIEIVYQLWNDSLPVNPSPGATIGIVLHSGVIYQTFTGVIQRAASTTRVPETDCHS